MNQKGQVNLLAPAILALVFAGIVLVFGLVIGQELKDTTEKGLEEFNQFDIYLKQKYHMKLLI